MTQWRRVSSRPAQRIAASVLALTMCASSALAETATARSGVRTRLASHWAHNRACEQRTIDIRVTQAPSYGALSWQSERMTIPAVNKFGERQSCAGRVMNVLVIYYQSAAGFYGQDQLRYWRVNMDNPNDPMNRETSYTITVR